MVAIVAVVEVGVAMAAIGVAVVAVSWWGY